MLRRISLHEFPCRRVGNLLTSLAELLRRFRLPLKQDFEELVVGIYRFHLAKYSLHELVACREAKPDQLFLLNEAPENGTGFFFFLYRMAVGLSTCFEVQTYLRSLPGNPFSRKVSADSHIHEAILVVGNRKVCPLFSPKPAEITG